MIGKEILVCNPRPKAKKTARKSVSEVQKLKEKVKKLQKELRQLKLKRNPDDEVKDTIPEYITDDEIWQLSNAEYPEDWNRINNEIMNRRGGITPLGYRARVIESELKNKKMQEFAKKGRKPKTDKDFEDYERKYRDRY